MRADSSGMVRRSRHRVSFIARSGFAPWRGVRRGADPREWRCRSRVISKTWCSKQGRVSGPLGFSASRTLTSPRDLDVRAGEEADWSRSCHRPRDENDNLSRVRAMALWKMRSTSLRLLAAGRADIRDVQQPVRHLRGANIRTRAQGDTVPFLVFLGELRSLSFLASAPSLRRAR